ncbi:MAG: M23 family metallopeptidase [Deltaproteobacteria bacterium]|nr:M23 family metallopeptidase [Deltaproteobacteria bacterium]MBN2671421.1 M23 family metallopeptidase [Deltaproteobacteria bacterium]
MDVNTTEQQPHAAATEVVTESTPKLKDSHKTALFISGIALAGLFGIMVGMFVASDKSAAPKTIAAAETQKTATWLAQAAAADTGAPPEVLAEAVPEETVVDTEAPANNGSVVRGTLKNGQAVVTALTDLGLTAADAQLMINALDGVFDFRRARPGHEFEITFGKESGKPEKFTYQASKTDIYLVELHGDAYKGRKLTISTDKEMKLFAGTITSSLFGTLKDLGAKAALAGKVADILSTQVNFLKEQRPGDTFKVMVEEESLDGEYLGYGPVLALEYNGVKAGQRRLYRFQEGNRNPTYYDDKMISTPSSALTIPLYYSRMSSPFGWRIHPVLKRRKLHNGVDFSASTGTPVWACADGQIIFAGNKGANGNLVGIQHENGLSSYYAHLHHIESGIKKGVTVKRKQVIGYVGTTGRSTGPHLHWGLKQNGKFIDPLKYKIIPGKKVASSFRAKLKAIIQERQTVLNRTEIEPPKGELDEVPDNDYPMGLDDI